MQNFLVCFYGKENTDVTYRIFVRQNNQDGASKKATDHLLSKGINPRKLFGKTVQAYGQSCISDIELI